MAKIWFLIIILLLSACSSSIIIKEKSTDGGVIRVKKSFFSGIHYLSIEKRKKSEKFYSILYDCPPKAHGKLVFNKFTYDMDQKVMWKAVTDTVQMKYFEDRVEGFNMPLTFQKITPEEKNILIKAKKKSLECSEGNEQWSVDRVIGFVLISN